MQKDKNRLFFCQTVQDTIALNFLLPIRTLSYSNRDVIFNYCKERKFLDANYDTYETFSQDLKKWILKIPNFLHGYCEEYGLKERLKEIRVEDIDYLRKKIYFTKSSLNPFLMASLHNTFEIKTLKTIFYLYLFYIPCEENILQDAKFFNLSYKFFHNRENLFMFGPVMSDLSFLNDDDRLEYVKNIKKYFNLNLHTYELLNMINQRNVISKDELVLKTKSAKKVLQVAQNNFVDKFYKKSTMRELATHYIVKSKSKKITAIADCIDKKSSKFKDSYERIKNNQIYRDLEALEWFNDLTFQNLSFENTNENLKNVILNYLQNMIQADGYITCRYIHFNQTFSLIEQNTSFTEHQKNDIKEGMELLNQDKKKLKASYTYDVINDYIKNKNPIKLIEDMSKYPHKLCKEILGANSVLSIHLIFDKRVFMVIHFISFSRYRFDEIDKRFLLKLSSALSKQYIVNDLNSSLDKTVALLEGLNKTTNLSPIYLKKKTDEVCQHIAQAFSCDGVAIWFNKKEVFQTPKEVNQLSILSQINFLTDSELKQNQLYTIADGEKDSIIVKNKHRDIVVINDIQTQCSDNRKDIFFMKYRDDFIKKGIKSMMFVPIKNHEGKLSGAVMIYDKSYRNYNQISQRMLIRISLYIGSILETITYAKYRAQKIDEKNLHESAQYLNIIDSRVKDLENILKNFNLLDSYEKYKLFLNIEDIKDFTSFTRNYLFSIFKGGKLVIKKYDELLDKSIKEIQHSKEYTSIKNSLNQVLAVNKYKMNVTKSLFYKNQLKHNFLIKIPSQQLHDVLNNIINNAIKYSNIGTNIKLWDEFVPPYFYYLYIENVGHPIYNEEFERIFQKGVRGYSIKNIDDEELQESLSENKGVGLYLAKGIIKDGLGGNIVLLESTPIGKSGYNKNIFVIKIPYKKTRKLR